MLHALQAIDAGAKCKDMFEREIKAASVQTTTAHACMLWINL